MQSHLTESAGFTLVELLVGSAIFAVGLGTMVTTTQNVLREMKRMEYRQEATQAAERLRTALANRRVCELNFVVNQTPKISVSASPLTSFDATHVDQFSETEVNLGPIVSTVAGVTPDFQPSALRLMPKADLPATNQVLADLLIYSQDPSDHYFRTVPLMLDMTAGVVSSCVSSGATDLQLQQKACLVASDGANVYDPVTKSCVPKTASLTVWGTNAFTAQCPAGYKVLGCGWDRPKNNGLTIGLFTTNSPTTLNCPVPVQLGTYKGVQGFTCPEFWKSTTLNADTCNFQYAVGVDTTGIINSAACVEVGI
ncbi:MAG: type II secretion system protein J [Bdellovibrionales bacterium]